jgi:hypothetical protein
MQFFGRFDLCARMRISLDCYDFCLEVFNVAYSGPILPESDLCTLGVAYEAASGCANPLPAQVTGLSATVTGQHVALSWTTVSESNNAGFDIEQQLAPGVFQPVGYAGGYGTTRTPQHYGYTVRDLSPGRHVFRLKQIDFDGSFEYSGTVEVTVVIPDQFVLEAAYPNPFNPTTTIRFAVPVEQAVTLTLTDSQGRTVHKLWEGTAAANEMHTVRVSSEGLASGVYVARLTGEGIEASESVTLVK